MCPTKYIYHGDIMDIDNMDNIEDPEWRCLQCKVLVSSEQKHDCIICENDFLDTEFETLDHV